MMVWLIKFITGILGLYIKLGKPAATPLKVNAWT